MPDAECYDESHAGYHEDTGLCVDCGKPVHGVLYGDELVAVESGGLLAWANSDATNAGGKLTKHRLLRTVNVDLPRLGNPGQPLPPTREDA